MPVNAIYLGRGKDRLGIACDVLEDPVTHRRYLAYSPEDWWARCQILNEPAPVPANRQPLATRSVGSDVGKASPD
jgi:hypothetical protein